MAHRDSALKSATGRKGAFRRALAANRDGDCEIAPKRHRIKQEPMSLIMWRRRHLPRDHVSREK